MSRYPGERLGLPESGPQSVGRVGRRFVAITGDWIISALVLMLISWETPFRGFAFLSPGRNRNRHVESLGQQCRGIRRVLGEDICWPDSSGLVLREGVVVSGEENHSLEVRRRATIVRRQFEGAMSSETRRLIDEEHKHVVVRRRAPHKDDMWGGFFCIYYHKN